MFYLSLMNVFLVNKAHPHTSNRKDPSHFNPYIVNQCIINTSWSLIRRLERKNQHFLNVLRN